MVVPPPGQDINFMVQPCFSNSSAQNFTHLSIIIFGYFNFIHGKSSEFISSTPFPPKISFYFFSLSFEYLTSISFLNSTVKFAEVQTGSNTYTITDPESLRGLKLLLYKSSCNCDKETLKQPIGIENYRRRFELDIFLPKAQKNALR